jgi:hypothetical protein
MPYFAYANAARVRGDLILPVSTTTQAIIAFSKTSATNDNMPKSHPPLIPMKMAGPKVHRRVQSL